MLIALISVHSLHGNVVENQTKTACIVSLIEHKEDYG